MDVPFILLGCLLCVFGVAITCGILNACMQFIYEMWTGEPYYVPTTRVANGGDDDDVSVLDDAAKPFAPHVRERASSADDKTNVCPVCLEPLLDTRLAAGPCDHWMHSECLMKWLRKDKHVSCPVCRVPLGEARQPVQKDGSREERRRGARAGERGGARGRTRSALTVEAVRADDAAPHLPAAPAIPATA